MVDTTDGGSRGGGLEPGVELGDSSSISLIVIRRWPYCPGREAVVSILLYSAKSKSAWCTREQRFGDVKHYIRMFDVTA